MDNSKESAFPLSGHTRTNIQNEKGEIIASTSSGMEGLTKREYFAGIALQGIISEGSFETNDEGIKSICGSSIKIADELLKQLEA